MPKTVNLYYKGTFDAAHYLPGYEGPCRKMHGHTWLVEVWLRGYVSSVNGMVLDFHIIRDALAELDHSLLNEVLAMPTAENIAKYLFKKLPPTDRIRVWESDHAYAEVDCTYENAIRALTPTERKRLMEGTWEGYRELSGE